jgi:hypothetical protein
VASRLLECRLMTRWWHGVAGCWLAGVALMGLGLALQGCAVLAIPAVASVAGGGAEELVKAGAASTTGGAASRTFKGSLPEVHAAVRRTLAELEFPEPDEKVIEERMILRTRAIDRQIRIDLRPVTSSLINVRVAVVRGLFSKEPATAEALTDLVADMLQPPPSALPRAVGASPRAPTAAR